MVPAGKSKRCYVFQRWGRTGTGGVCRLQGPMEQAEVESHLYRVFKSKTGATWGSLSPGEKAMPGKYWPVLSSDADSGARWQFNTESFGAGSGSGTRSCAARGAGGNWCSYDAEANHQMEELYAEHKANGKSSNPMATRLVTSGTFAYQVDFEALVQRNTASKTERRIRRVVTAGTSETIPGIPQSAAPAHRSNSAELTSTQQSAAGSMTRQGSASTVNTRRESLEAPSSYGDMLSIVRSGSIELLSTPALRDWLRKRNISASGKKYDLVDRVRAVVW